MSIILGLLFPKKRKPNLRAGTLAHEDFFLYIESYMKENNIEWSDLGCDGPRLLKMYESYKDEKINQVFKTIDKDLPDLKLPY